MCTMRYRRINVYNAAEPNDSGTAAVTRASGPAYGCSSTHTQIIHVSAREYMCVCTWCVRV